MSPKPTPQSKDRPESAAPALETKPAPKRPESRAAGELTPKVAARAARSKAAVAAERSSADERVEDRQLDGVSGSRRRRSVAPSRFSRILVAILAGSALFVGGFSLGAHVATTPGTPTDEEARFAAFWEVYHLIQSQYAGSPKPTQDELVQAAIKGMLASLNDPWSYYQAPSDYQNSLLGVGGQAEGIGVFVKLQPVDPADSLDCQTIGNGCELAIDKPIPGSPAEAAGIQPGDVIVSAGGVSLDGKTVDEAIALIKGPKDTSVTIGLHRGTKSFELTIVRKVYALPEVTTKIFASGAVAYIQVTGINENASSQFDLALATALAAGQHNIIIDLRGNLGGYVVDAVKIASEFIGSGTIAWQQDASDKTTEVAAIPGGRATDNSVQVVVLVDGNTASAAEMLAGALQSHGRAKLIGAKTYGKGVVQEWLPLPNDFGGVHLTIARWLTPDKVWIQGKGLQPDVPISSDGARAGTDPVLDAGLQQLGFEPQPVP
ncbi:MAG: S41 family peptidase [Candidatus Limnocylindrales bacterium]